MRKVWRRVVGGYLYVDRALLRVRNSMTPGQRWTSALAMIVAIGVLAFGLPTSRLLWAGYAATPPTAAPPAAQTVPGAAPPPVAPVAPVGVAAPVAAAPAAPTVDATPALLPSAAGVPSVVALTVPDATPVAARDDTAMADAALATAVFPWTAIPDSGNAAALCARVAVSGHVVLAAHALSKSLEDCLLGNGLIVVSPSPRGTRRLMSEPGGTGTGLSLSVRRSYVDSLSDLARWAHTARALPGRVGLVLDSAHRDDLAAAASVVHQRGVNVVSTAWLSSSSSATDVLKAVNGFAGARVSSVLFAVPVAVQRTWAAEATARQFTYVVSDVDDGISDERYAPTFNGARAHTSLRVPWYSRDHGQTADQQFCSAQWTSSQTAPAELPNEQVPVDTWCEEAGLLNQAITEAVLASGNLATALLTRRMSSPLTSDLGPLPDGLWGPTADAVLTWRATCNCWQEAAGFHAR